MRELSASEFRGKIDFGIITIREDEQEAINQHFPPLFDQVKGQLDCCISRVELENSEYFSIVLANCASLQGTSKAQTVTSNLIYDFDPNWILLVGIARAVPDWDFSLGDVVLSNQVYDCRLQGASPGGKKTWSIGGGEMHPDVLARLANLKNIEQRFKGWNSTESIGMEKPHLSEISISDCRGNEDQIEKVVNTLKHNFKEPRLPLYIRRAIASSDVLVKDPDLMDEWLRGARYAKAFEMELSGAYEAAKTREKSYPILSIRGISDVVGFDRNKNRNWTTYACKTAAAFTKALINSRALIVQTRQSDKQSQEQLQTQEQDSMDNESRLGNISSIKLRIEVLSICENEDGLKLLCSDLREENILDIPYPMLEGKSLESKVQDLINHLRAKGKYEEFILWFISQYPGLRDKLVS